MQITKIITLALTLLTLPAWADPEIKGTPAELVKYLPGLPGSVTIRGEGKVRVQADQAVVSLSIANENRTLAEALKKNDAIRRDLSQILGKRGIPADRIKSLRFSSVPGHSAITGKVKNYRVENVLKITVENEAQFQMIAEAMEQREEVQFLAVEPEHSQTIEQRSKSLEAAAEDVLRQKAVLEKTFALKLMPRRFAGADAERDMLTAGLRNRVNTPTVSTVTGILTDPQFRVAIHALEQNPGSDSPFGELVYVTTISVEFELRKE